MPPAYQQSPYALPVDSTAPANLQYLQPEQRQQAVCGGTSNDATISAEKRARKAAEEDAARLYNRVKQLQKEEDKAKRRVDETKQKAAEILKLRERNEQRQQEREQRLVQLQQEISKAREVSGTDRCWDVLDLQQYMCTVPQAHSTCSLLWAETRCC